MPEATQAALQGAHFGIWTTTPWTIPANLAVAVNDALEYAVVEVQVCGKAELWMHGRLRRWQCMFVLGLLQRDKLWRGSLASVPPLRKPIPSAVRQGDLPEGWGARRLVVAADLAAALAEKFGISLTTLATIK